jgi:hypothetical protein
MSAYQSAVLADSPLVYWRSDTASGTTEPDASGNGRTGTISGISRVSGAPIGESHNSYHYNAGTSVHIHRANESWMSAASLSVEAWARPETSSTNSRTVVSRHNTSGHLWTLRIDTNGGVLQAMFYCTRASDGTVHSLGSGAATPLVLGRWYHVVGVVDSTGMSIYVDGVRMGFRSDVTAISTSISQPLYVGRTVHTATDGRWLGRIDEVALYNYGLAADRIHAHYYAGNPVMAATPAVTVDQIENTTARITGSAYSHPESASHVRSQFCFRRVSDGATVHVSGQLGAVLQHTPSSGGLVAGTQYIAEVRYGDDDRFGLWGQSAIFMAGVSVAPTVAIDQTGPLSGTVGTGGTLTATATGTPTPTLAWESDAPSIVSIDPATGEFERLAAGSATITVTATNSAGSDDDSISVTVMVYPFLPAPVLLSPANGATVTQPITLQWGAVTDPECP